MRYIEKTSLIQTLAAVLLLLAIFNIQESKAQTFKPKPLVELRIKRTLYLKDHLIKITLPITCKKENSIIIERYDWSKMTKNDSLTYKNIINISCPDINNLEGLVLKLENEQLIKSVLSSKDIIGMDGCMVKLSISKEMNHINYNIWSPNYSTKERDLEVFLELCEFILELVNIKPNFFLN